MSRVFADSFYFFALLNPNDAAHERAFRFSQQNAGPLLTTAWVIAELADALASTAQRNLFRRVLRDLEANSSNLIIPPTDALFRRGTDLYDSRLDKEWSLTDCISFLAMEDAGLSDALTGDHHFEQAGFRCF